MRLTPARVSTVLSQFSHALFCKERGTLVVTPLGEESLRGPRKRTLPVDRF